MKYKKYSCYKDSGLEWLGKIPSQWTNSKLKYHAFVYNGNSISDSEKENYENLDITSSIPYVSTKDIDSNFLTINYDNGMRVLICNDKFKIAKKSSTLICIEGGSAGKKLALLNEKVCFVNKLACIDSYNGLDKRFSNYIMRSSIFNYLFNLSTTGLIPGVSINQLKDFEIILPSIQEQQQIAKFLDNATQKMDILIQKQENLIKLLKEKRQSVISHAVTRGLNSDVKFKDSGVEWLGDVPEHWEVMQIKRLSSVRRGASPRPIDNPIYFDEEGEYAWVRIADVSKTKGYLNTTLQQLSKLGSSLSVKINPGELFISIAGTVGKPCISNIKACIHDGFVYFPHLKNKYIKLLYRIFEAGECYGGLGKMGTQLNLNTETIGSISISIPPDYELINIIKYIDDKTSKIDTLIEKSNQSIELLKEKRTALISACVTGKIDVRELV